MVGLQSSTPSTQAVLHLEKGHHSYASRDLVVKMIKRSSIFWGEVLPVFSLWMLD